MNTHSKRCAVSLFAVLALTLMYAEANAASVQVRAGVGGLGGPNQKGDFQQEGVDMFIYEGRRVELFVGVEMTSTKDAATGGYTGNGTNSAKLNYKLDITAATFGVRFKPALSGRWRPYLDLGGIAGKADYKTDITAQSNEILLSTGSGSTNFVSARIGLGMDVGLGEQWSIGVAVTYTQSAPAFNVVVADLNTGRIEDRKLNENADMVGASLGLRYAF